MMKMMMTRRPRFRHSFPLVTLTSNETSAKKVTHAEATLRGVEVQDARGTNSLGRRLSVRIKVPATCMIFRRVEFSSPKEVRLEDGDINIILDARPST